MASDITILDPFNRIQLGPFITKYQDWIFFTLLLFFFWAVAGIALRKKFEQSRYLTGVNHSRRIDAGDGDVLFDLSGLAAFQPAGPGDVWRHTPVYRDIFHHFRPHARVRHAISQCTAVWICAVLYQPVGSEPQHHA